MGWTHNARLPACVESREIATAVEERELCAQPALVFEEEEGAVLTIDNGWALLYEMGNITGASDAQPPGHPLPSYGRVTPEQLRQFNFPGITLWTGFQHVRVRWICWQL